MEYEILLINISRDSSSYSKNFQDNIGQYLIASYISLYSFKAYVYSGNVIDCKKVIENEITKNKVPIVGFYIAADNIRVVRHTITWIKNNFNDVKTVVGGPQVIALDYNFFKETGNDFAIISEGEIPMYFLLSSIIDKKYMLSDVPSLITKDDIKNCLIVNRCDSAIVNNLDTIPHPKLEDSLIKNLYQGRVVGIITGRGCPFQCSFCYEGANAKNVRFRSIKNVMQEIDYIIENNKHLEYISIYDDTFTLNKDRILEFCKEIKKRKIKWFCEGHISFISKNKNVLDIMIDAGLVNIQFGIESGSNIVLNAYNKHTNYNMIIETIKMCKQSGLHGVSGNFIIGGAFETVETIEEGKRLAKDLIDSAKGIIELYVVYFAPYPNTEIVNNPKKFNIKINEELEKYNLNTMRSAVVETNKLSTKEIYNLKQEFESYIEQLYKEASKDANKKDVLQGLFENGKRIHINPTWEKYYLSHSYIATFLEHITTIEQKFNPKNYIIRTFEDFVLDKDRMSSEVGDFFGLEKDILLNSTGIYNAEEMASMFKVDLIEIEKIYIKLNEKCLVYMSEF